MLDDPIRFKELFQVSILIFYYNIELVCVVCETNPSFGLEHLSNRKLENIQQIVLVICRLTLGDSILTIGEIFGVSNSIVSKVVINFVQLIICCSHHHLTWPNHEKSVCMLVCERERERTLSIIYFTF